MQQESVKQRQSGNYYVIPVEAKGSKTTLITNMNEKNAKEAMSSSKCVRAEALRRQMKEDGRIEEASGLFTVSHDGRECWDDASGRKLKINKIKEAGKEELKFFKDYEVYVKVPGEECWRVAGKPPIGVKWMDVNKGDHVE